MSLQPHSAQVAAADFPRNAVAILSLGSAEYTAHDAVLKKMLQGESKTMQDYWVEGCRGEHRVMQLAYRQRMEELVGITEPLYTLMIAFHKQMLKDRSEELEWMKVVQTFHLYFGKFLNKVLRESLSPAEVDRFTDEYGAKLREFDRQVKKWSHRRMQDDTIMSDAHVDAVVQDRRRSLENVRQQEAQDRHRLREISRRKEAHGRRGQGLGGDLDFKGYEVASLVQDIRSPEYEAWLKEHGQWLNEHTLWLQTYRAYVEYRQRNLTEYDGLVKKQAELTRGVGNYQNFRFFEECKRLNEAAATANRAEGAVVATGELKGKKKKTLQEHLDYIDSGTHRIEWWKNGQMVLVGGKHYKQKKMKRRNSL